MATLITMKALNIKQRKAGVPIGFLLLRQAAAAFVVYQRMKAVLTRMNTFLAIAKGLYSTFSISWFQTSSSCGKG